VAERDDPFGRGAAEDDEVEGVVDVDRNAAGAVALGADVDEVAAGGEPVLDFRLDFDTPNAGFVPSISFLGFQILPEHILGSVDPAQLQKHPFFLNPTVASGPFKFVKYETDQYIQVDRNPNFWGPTAKLERIFVHTTTPDVATAQLVRKEVDVVHFWTWSEVDAAAAAARRLTVRGRSAQA